MKTISSWTVPLSDGFMIDKLTDQSASRRRSASGAFYFPTLERVGTHNTNGRSIITNIIITTLDLQRSTVEERRKPHRPLTAHQHGRKDIRSAGNGRDSGVVLEREVLAPAQRNLGWLEKYRWVNLSTSRGSVSSVSFSILHVYDPAGLWEVRPVSHLHHHHHHHHHHHCWRCCAQGFILSWWWWCDCFVLLHIVTESLYELGQWQELNMARLLE